MKGNQIRFSPNFLVIPTCFTTTYWPVNTTVLSVPVLSLMALLSRTEVEGEASDDEEAEANRFLGLFQEVAVCSLKGTT